MSTADAKPPERDEAQMIVAILAGDRELYHRLIQPYELSVYRMALSFMKDETEAEDVAQEAFARTCLLQITCRCQEGKQEKRNTNGHMNCQT